MGLTKRTGDFFNGTLEMGLIWEMGLQSHQTKEVGLQKVPLQKDKGSCVPLRNINYP